MSAIIPTYNEAENIRVLIPQILDVFKRHFIDGRIIIIDDASTDGTGKIAQNLSKEIGRIHVIIRQGKLGIGSAYKNGFRYALSQGYNGIIEMDADLSHDSSFIPQFMKKLEDGYDLVIGSRYVPGGRHSNWSISRRIISRLTNWAIRFLFGLSTHDNTSGYRAYSSHALRTVDLTSVKSDGYAFQVEMVILCQKSRLRISEIPITFMDRSHGKSKLSIGEMWRFVKAMIRLAFA